MTYEGLLMVLTHMHSYEEGRKLLQHPVLVANDDQTRFLGISGLQVLRNMQNMVVLNVTTRYANEKTISPRS